MSWVPLDTRGVAYLPKFGARPYTELEALFSIQVDYFHGHPATIAGYAALWRWSRKRTKKFLQDVGMEIAGQKGQAPGQLRPSSQPKNDSATTHLIFHDFGNLDNLKSQQCLSDAPADDSAVEHSCIKDNKKEDKNFTATDTKTVFGREGSGSSSNNKGDLDFFCEEAEKTLSEFLAHPRWSSLLQDPIIRKDLETKIKTSLQKKELTSTYLMSLAHYCGREDVHDLMGYFRKGLRRAYGDDPLMWWSQNRSKKKTQELKRSIFQNMTWEDGQALADQELRRTQEYLRSIYS